MFILSIDTIIFDSLRAGHVIVEEKYYEKLDEPSDEENDMLDLAFGLTDTYVYLLNDYYIVIS
jgi:hypothetical protein